MLIVFIAFVVPITVMVLWRRHVRIVAERHEKALMAKVLEPGRFSLNEPKRQLPIFQEIKMRPCLSPKFAEQAEAVIGKNSFASEVSPFLRVAVYYLASLEQMFGEEPFNCLSDGQGVPTSPVDAARWFLKAAENGNAEGQLEYAIRSLEGNGCEQNEELGVERFLKSAELGCAEAMNRLGVCYRDGVGVQADRNRALDWFRLAAGNQHPDGMFNLGECHWYGRGIPANREEAKLWYKDAADAGSAEARQKLVEIGAMVGQATSQVE